MKRIFVFFLLLGNYCFAQDANPVEWEFEVRKVSELTFDVHITATIEQPWHIYSKANTGSTPQPTTIEFKHNPLVTLEGSIREIGKLEQKYESVFKKTLKYYNERVEFVQRIKLKTNVKTNIGGTIQYMVCTDAQCLPPAKQSFKLLVTN